MSSIMRRRNGLMASSVMGMLLSDVRLATPHLQTGRAHPDTRPAACRSTLPRERFSPLALFGHGAMSDLSPLSAAKRTSRSKGGRSGCVKVFGCRPHEGGAAHSGAGVRKPPMEETAGRDTSGGAAWVIEN